MLQLQQWNLMRHIPSFTTFHWNLPLHVPMEKKKKLHHFCWSFRGALNERMNTNLYMARKNFPTKMCIFTTQKCKLHLDIWTMILVNIITRLCRQNTPVHTAELLPPATTHPSIIEGVAGWPLGTDSPPPEPPRPPLPLPVFPAAPAPFTLVGIATAPDGRDGLAGALNLLPLTADVTSWTPLLMKAPLLVGVLLRGADRAAAVCWEGNTVTSASNTSAARESKQ